MELVPICLIPTAAAMDPEPDLACVLDALWSAATAEDQLEHITLARGPGRLEVVLFHRIRFAERSDVAAAGICARACVQAPLLRGWTISHRLPAP
jgi:hypothetical protein